MTTRLASTYAECRKNNRAALVTFIMAWDPTLETSTAILEALPQAGADIIELGMPFSDPMADGPVIDAAGKRALKAGCSLSKVLAMVTQFRRLNQHTPIILMGYFNPILQYGIERFIADADKAGVDGVILVDLPYEEAEEFTQHLGTTSLAFIRLLAPTTGEERSAMIAKEAQGFIYYISMKGITGSTLSHTQGGDLADAVHTIRRYNNVPVAVGFGIRTAEQAHEVAQHADGVVVGSAIVKEISESQTKDEAVKRVTTLVSSLAKAMHR